MQQDIRRDKLAIGSTNATAISNKLSPHTYIGNPPGSLKTHHVYYHFHTLQPEQTLK